MATKVKELVANPMLKRSDDPNCVICHQRPEKVRHDQVWRYSLRTGVQPLKDGVRA